MTVVDEWGHVLDLRGVVGVNLVVVKDEVLSFGPMREYTRDCSVDLWARCESHPVARL
jgi:hypothetical protein